MHGHILRVSKIGTSIPTWAGLFKVPTDSGIWSLQGCQYSSQPWSTAMVPRGYKVTCFCAFASASSTCCTWAAKLEADVENSSWSRRSSQATSIKSSTLFRQFHFLLPLVFHASSITILQQLLQSESTVVIQIDSLFQAQRFFFLQELFVPTLQRVSLWGLAHSSETPGWPPTSNQPAPPFQPPTPERTIPHLFPFS